MVYKCSGGAEAPWPQLCLAPPLLFTKEAERTPSTFISLLKGWADVQTKGAAVLMRASWCYASGGSLTLHKNGRKGQQGGHISHAPVAEDVNTCARAKDTSWQQTSPLIKGHVWVEVR